MKYKFQLVSKDYTPSIEGQSRDAQMRWLNFRFSLALSEFTNPKEMKSIKLNYLIRLLAEAKSKSLAIDKDLTEILKGIPELVAFLGEETIQ